MNWLIIALVILALIFILKVRHIKHRTFLIFLVLLILFLSITFSKVMSDNSVNLRTAQGVFSAVKVYFSWIAHAFGNLKVLLGNVVKMDWFPGNSTG